MILLCYTSLAPLVLKSFFLELCSFFTGVLCLFSRVLFLFFEFFFPEFCSFFMDFYSLFLKFCYFLLLLFESVSSLLSFTPSRKNAPPPSPPMINPMHALVATYCLDTLNLHIVNREVVNLLSKQMRPYEMELTFRFCFWSSSALFRRFSLKYR